MSDYGLEWQPDEDSQWVDNDNAQWDGLSLMNRFKTTIDSDLIDATLTDFPVMLNISSDSGLGSADLTEFFDELTSDANRKKIAVTTSDGQTQCPVEIEHFDIANEVAVLHTKIPSVSSSEDTELYVYYDSDQINNTAYVGDTGDTPAQNVWDDDFIGVYHLAQDPSGTAPQIKDSTSNGNDLTSNGSMTDTDLIDSEPGKGIDFDGNNDHLTRTNAIITAYPFTMEAAGPATVVASTNTNPSCGLAYTNTDSDILTLAIYNGYARAMITNTNYAQGTVLITDGDLVHLAAKHTNATTHEIFTNGQDKQSDSTNYAFSANINRTSIGGVQDSTPAYRQGEVSEVRFSDIARTDAWIKATYHALFDTFITWSTGDVYVEAGTPAQIVWSVHAVDFDVTIEAGTPAQITWSPQASTVSVSVPAGTPAQIAWSVLSAGISVAVLASTPSIAWSALAATVTQNLNAIGIVSKPTVSASKPSVTATGRQPNASATAAGPSVTITGRQPNISAAEAEPSITVTVKGD